MRVWLDHLIGPKPQSKSKSTILVNPVQAKYIWIYQYYVGSQQIGIETAALIVQVQHFKLFCTNAHKITINKILMKIRKITKVFEAYALFSQGVLGESLDKPNMKKCFGHK